MATIEVIIRDDEGNVIGNEDKRIYTIGIGKTSWWCPKHGYCIIYLEIIMGI
jgi:hypothetical protein